MTYGKRQWDEYDAQMRHLIPIVDKASNEMIAMIDADTNAFNDYMVRPKLYVNLFSPLLCIPCFSRIKRAVHNRFFCLCVQ